MTAEKLYSPWSFLYWDIKGYLRELLSQELSPSQQWRMVKCSTLLSSQLPCLPKVLEALYWQADKIWWKTLYFCQQEFLRGIQLVHVNTIAFVMAVWQLMYSLQIVAKLCRITPLQRNSIIHILCRRYVRYLHKPTTIVASIFRTSNGTQFYLSSTIISRHNLFVHVICSSADLHWRIHI